MKVVRVWAPGMGGYAVKLVEWRGWRDVRAWNPFSGSWKFGSGLRKHGLG